MSIKISVNGASVNKPGAYSTLKVSALTGFPLTAAGVVGIVGPSDGGAPGFAGPFSQDNIQNAKLIYKSGPLADAFDLLVNPSADERIVNGASQIYVYKTNQSTQASLALGGWGSLTSKLYGISANQVSAAIALSQAEIAPAFSFTYVAPAVDAKFNCRVDGGAVQTVTILNADNAAAAAAKIAGLVGLTASAVGSVISVSVDAALIEGMGQALEVIDGAGTNALTTIGISASVIGAVIASAQEKKIQYTIKHPDYDDEISAQLGGEIAMQIGYKGTTASLTITDSALQTTVAGGLGANLNLLFSNFNNLQEMVDFIDAQTDYSCSTSFAQASVVSPAILDNVSAVGICSSAAALKSGKVKADSNAVASAISELSNLVSVSESSKIGLPAAMVTTYLAGAVLGAAANSDFQAGFDAFKLHRINSVVPVISEDGSAEGFGTYDWDSIAAQLKSHVAWGWSTLGKSERQGFIGKWAAKADLIAAAKVLNSGYVALCGQKVKRINAVGSLVFMKPWAAACICAGLQEGAAMGEPSTFKYVNVSGIDQNGWEPKEDYAELIDAGVTFFEKVDTGGYRVVVGNTTYGKDANFVWNRNSVVRVGGYVAYDLRSLLESQFTGTKAATAARTAIENFIKARMTDYFNNDIIVADDSAPRGYKNLSVIMNGNTAVINITVYPVQGIDFILPVIYLESAVNTGA